MQREGSKIERGRTLEGCSQALCMRSLLPNIVQRDDERIGLGIFAEAGSAIDRDNDSDLLLDLLAIR
jgi:hypothetical protein